jgi:hypothetical protein
MFFKEASQDVKDHGSIAAGSAITIGFKAILIFTAFLIILLGLFPFLLTEWLHF